jgi:ribonuclease R
MADDYYRFVERAHILRGETNGRTYRLGDQVLVQVIRVDLERRQVDLGLADILESVRASGGKKSKDVRAASLRAAAGRGARAGKRPGRRERGFRKAARSKRR